MNRVSNMSNKPFHWVILGILITVTLYVLPVELHQAIKLLPMWLGVVVYIVDLPKSE